MPAYIEPSAEIIDIAKTYMKKGESIKVSGVIELNGKLYKEVIFLKRNKASFRIEAEGYIYLDNSNNTISSENIQKELAKLAYFYEIFYGEDKGRGILAAFQSQGDFQRDKDKFNEVLKGLDYLNAQGIENALEIKKIVEKLPAMREANNLKINKLMELIEASKDKDITFNEGFLEKFYPAYEDILRLNFEKVKLIDSGKDCYDEVKDAADRNRKKWAVRFDRSITGPLMEAANQISYFRRIIRTYKGVLNMSTPQYMKFFNEITKEKIDSRTALIRK